MYKDDYAIEAVDGGFMAAEYSGKHSRFGAAYAGKEGEWHPLAKDIGKPFAKEADVKKFIDKVMSNATDKNE